MKKKKISRPKTDADSELSFEAALSELERIVAALEENELGLERSLTHYERGVARLNHCYQLLEQAQRKISLLRGVDEAGQPVTEPFEEDELTLEAKKHARARRRSHATPSAGRGARELQDDGENTDGSDCLF